jgi:tRNA G46 methylase TrmB
MAPPRKPPKKDQPSTYFMPDRDKEELERLRLQDELITQYMGGVLPEQADPTRFQQVLDVGCGTGGWLLELAKTSPSKPSRSASG